MRFIYPLIITLALSGCVDNITNNPNRKEVSIDGRAIYVADLGNGKIEMRRKGVYHSREEILHWEDFLKAGEQATGCKVENLVPMGSIGNLYYWTQATIKCSKSGH
ncbi:MAG: hypothetical protein IPP74_10280 [Alphaproteobacteria bacterium]|nr:hypothetical protein [Alphaproteobacteria bacterium]